MKHGRVGNYNIQAFDLSTARTNIRVDFGGATELVVARLVTLGLSLPTLRIGSPTASAIPLFPGLKISHDDNALGKCYLTNAASSAAGDTLDFLTFAAGDSPEFDTPGRGLVASRAGRGLFRLILGTVPAAGAEILETVPAGKLWKVLSVATILTADANVATRVVTWRLLNAAGNIIYQFAGADQTAGATRRHLLSSAPTFGFADNFSNYHYPLPVGMIIEATNTIGTSTFSIQVGDQFSVPVITVEEFDV